MPRIVHCDTEGCALKTAAGFHAKFCPECGSKAADKVEVIKARCKNPECNVELSDTARFCSECGTKVERELVSELLAGHERPGEVTTGRGLTERELAAIEASIRKPSKVADPTREYEVDPEHAKIMGLKVPGSENKSVEMSQGRIASTAPDGKHSPGSLSSDASVPANYAESVRVIPYQFRTPARSPSTMVEDTRGGPAKGKPARIASSGGSLSDEDAAFFRDLHGEDPPGTTNPVVSDVQAAKKARTKKAADKEAAKKAAKRGKRPQDREQCLECGRLKNEAGECQHCLKRHAEDEAELAMLEGLWDSGPG